jgi:hypothetical protein
LYGCDKETEQGAAIRWSGKLHDLTSCTRPPRSTRTTNTCVVISGCSTAPGSNPSLDVTTVSSTSRLSWNTHFAPTFFLPLGACTSATYLPFADLATRFREDKEGGRYKSNDDVIEVDSFIEKTELTPVQAFKVKVDGDESPFPEVQACVPTTDDPSI